MMIGALATRWSHAIAFDFTLSTGLACPSRASFAPESCWRRQSGDSNLVVAGGVARSYALVWIREA